MENSARLQKRQLRDHADRLVVGLFLFLSSGAFYRLWHIRKLLSFLCLLCGFYLLVRLSRSVRKAELLRFLPYVVFVGYFAASLLWSTAPRFSARPHLELLFHMAVAVCIASRYSWKEQLDLYYWPFVAVAATSIVFIVFFPDYGLMSPVLRIDLANRWTGVLPHKNLLGHLSALSGLFFLLYAKGKRRSVVVFSLAAACVNFTLMIGSGSKAALVAVVLTVATTTLLVFLSRTRSIAPRAKVFVVLAALAVAVWGYSKERLELLLGLLGRDSTFTGRTAVWAGTWEAAGHRPWFGYGYAGFWAAKSESQAALWPCAFIWDRVDWRPNHSHNVFLDCLIEGGVVGLLLFAAVVVLSAKRAFASFRRELSQAHPRYEVALWPLGLFVFFFFSNLTESLLLRKSFIYYVIFLITAYSLGKNPERATAMSSESPR